MTTPLELYYSSCATCAFCAKSDGKCCRATINLANRDERIQRFRRLQPTECEFYFPQIQCDDNHGQARR